MHGKPLRLSKLLFAVVVALALLEGATPLENARVRSIGDLLKCDCGCNATITGCNMINCHYADPVRLKLLELVEAGKTDEQIFAEMETQYGKKILQRPPSDGFYALGWIMPWAGTFAGLGMVYLVLRYYMRKRPVPAGTSAAGSEEPPEMARYRARIEKEMEDLD